MRRRSEVTPEIEEYMAHARKVMDDNGLTHWDLVLEENKFELGRTDYRSHIIAISVDFLEIMTHEEAEETLYHEVAHAVVGYPGRFEMMLAGGHDAAWRARMAKFGFKDAPANAHIKTPWPDPPMAEWEARNKREQALGRLDQSYFVKRYPGKTPENHWKRYLDEQRNIKVYDFE